MTARSLKVRHRPQQMLLDLIVLRAGERREETVEQREVAVSGDGREHGGNNLGRDGTVVGEPLVCQRVRLGDQLLVAAPPGDRADQPGSQEPIVVRFAGAGKPPELPSRAPESSSAGIAGNSASGRR